jgi:hypothetical protein
VQPDGCGCSCDCAGSGAGCSSFYAEQATSLVLLKHNHAGLLWTVTDALMQALMQGCLAGAAD